MNSRPRVRSVTPLLVVTELQRALDFYTAKLAFIDPAVHGEPPCFALLNRVGFELMLSVAGPQSNARLDSLDQNAHDLEIERIEREGAKLRFEMHSIGAAYDGEVSAAQDELRGTWTQRGASFPLVFRRA